MKSIRRMPAFGLALVCAGLCSTPAFSADIVGAKNIVSYIVTLDSITPGFLLFGGGKTATVEFSVTPKNKAKFAPQAVTLYIDNTPIEVTGVDEQGTYTVELIEGEDLPAVKNYAIQIAVDNAQTGIQNIVVFDFAGKFTPTDNFTGRSLTQYGIAELVDLDAVIIPAGTVVDDIGGLKWTLTGVGGLSGNPDNDGTEVFAAGSSAGTADFKLEIVSGPDQGTFKTYSRPIIAPSGENMVRDTAFNIYHTQNTASVGFKGNFFILPKDVSFKGILQREGAGTGTGSGFYASGNGAVHGYSVWFTVGACNTTTGCGVNSVDTVEAIAKGPPYSVGDFLWPIRHEYCVGNATSCSTTYPSGTPGPLLTIANHHQTADAAGRCCIQKINAGPFCKDASDASVAY